MVELLSFLCWEKQFVHDVEYTFNHHREVPLKNVHVAWQNIWVRCVLKLLNRETLVFKSDVSSLVLKNITVVRGGEERNDRRWLVKTFPVVKLEAFKFGLVGTHDWNQSICEEEVVGDLGAKDNGAATNFVKGIIKISYVLFIDGVRPKNVK